jgi:hypothetical protein
LSYRITRVINILTVKIRITGLGTVAKQVVIAICIIWHLYTGIVAFVTGIVGAGDSVVAVGRCAGLAGAGSGVTGLRTVAEHAIITVRVNRALRRHLA